MKIKRCYKCKRGRLKKIEKEVYKGKDEHDRDITETETIVFCDYCGDTKNPNRHKDLEVSK